MWVSRANLSGVAHGFVTEREILRLHKVVPLFLSPTSPGCLDQLLPCTPPKAKSENFHQKSQQASDNCHSLFSLFSWPNLIKGISTLSITRRPQLLKPVYLPSKFNFMIREKACLFERARRLRSPFEVETRSGKEAPRHSDPHCWISQGSVMSRQHTRK